MHCWAHQVPVRQSSGSLTPLWPRTVTNLQTPLQCPLAPVQKDHVCPLRKELLQKQNVCSWSIARLTRSRWFGDTTKVSKWTMWHRCTETKVASSLSGCHVRKLTAHVCVGVCPVKVVITRPTLDRACWWGVGKRKTNTKGPLLRKCRIQQSLLCNHNSTRFLANVCTFGTTQGVSGKFHFPLVLSLICVCVHLFLQLDLQLYE